ncbi:molybdate ABC transporter permease subunit [Nitratireductor sp. ZSWI3]|uniref:molybdate ABC transporter permease subunit n=1 Tax=Nitratireductor sp. ZSWI3 TaxID=2966359 RepID=UPI00214F7331|nr:molybdate ABC transporter permease subunit [Nitratireductor sp. ZSWI3]MCR4264981.1 molybdate ABC transporter permease subunit [Nitratireductor sp. ZSWI3]
MMSEAEISIILLSAKVAFVAIACALLPAFAIAWLLARKRFAGRGLLQALVTLPLVLPPVATGYGLLILFGTKGPLGRFFDSLFGLEFAFRWTGAALAAGVMAFPLLVRPIRLSLEAIDQGYAEAARTLGASRLVVFLTVTLPLALPGIIAGAVLGFAKALGEFGATITFVSNIPGQTQTLSLAIYALLQTPSGDAAAMRLILLAIALALLAIIASELLARKLTRDRP